MIRQEMFEANPAVTVAEVNTMINNAKRVNFNFCLDCGNVRMQPLKDANGNVVKLANTNYKLCSERARARAPQGAGREGPREGPGGCRPVLNAGP